MLELTTSHRSLRILVGGEEAPVENLLISLLGPRYICGPTSWEGSDICLMVTQLDSGEEGIVLIDAENEVRVVADTFEVAENVKWWRGS